MFAIYTLEAQESVRQHAAFEEGLEFLGNVLWKMFALKCAQVLEASQVFLHDFVEECGFRASTNVAGIVPRKGCLPAMCMAVRVRMSLALLLHNGLTLQLQGRGCSRSPPCCSGCPTSLICNISIKDSGDVGLFARSTHKNKFRNIVIENSADHGIFLARHPEQPASPHGGTPAWDTVTDNEFSNIHVRASKKGAGIRINDSECTGNSIRAATFEENALGDFSLSEGVFLLSDLD